MVFLKYAKSDNKIYGDIIFKKVNQFLIIVVLDVLLKQCINFIF